MNDIPRDIHLLEQPKIIVGDDQRRAEKCLAEIIPILNRYDCEMHPEIILAPGQTTGRVRVTPKPRGVPK